MLLLCIVTVVVIDALGVDAQETKQGSATATKIPIFDQEPHDKIYLDDLNDNAVLKVIPLEFPHRRVPREQPSGNLAFQYLDQPNKSYKVDWSRIRKIELFEEMILAEANRLTKRRKFDDAYWHIDFLLNNYPDTSQLSASIVDYLIANAKDEFNAGKYHDALSMLEEVQQRSPDKVDVLNGIRRVMDKLLGQYIEREEYWQARQLLLRRDRKTSSDWDELVERWEEKLNKMAGRYLDEAQNHLASQRYRNALDATHRALKISPSLPGVRELVTQLAREYPIVMVGVTQLASETTASSTAAWSARRTTRLFHRDLIEYIGRGAEGGKYYCPWGTFLEDEAGTLYHLKLRDFNGRSFPKQRLTAYQVSRSLLSMADPTQPGYQATWEEILESVVFVDELQLDVQLRNTFVRPEALLNVTINRSATDSYAGPDGPYVVGSHSAGKSVYFSQPDFILASRNQPREIIERLITDRGSAVSLLESGEVDVIDRVNLRYLSQLKEAPSISVDRYDVPTVHVLVPNVQKNSVLTNKMFRRALVYAIQRDVILNELILGGSSVEGCEVISGPFPKGFTTDDPLGYAHNSRVKPRAYRPAMASVLFGVAMEQSEKPADDSAGDPPGLKPLVLAHPQGDIARIACRAIAEQLNAVKIPCRVKPMAAGVIHPQDDFDLLYMEWTITEPVIDAARLFGPKGFMSGPSPYLSHTVRQLNRVSNWKEARVLLEKIHQIVNHEVTIIPLWQIADHFAYHRRLSGIGTGPVHLYQNIEQWNITP